MTETTGRLDRGNGTELAWIRREGHGPTVVFLPGFRSDMTGDKAMALAAFCAERGLPYCQATLLGSYAQALRHLNEVGKLTRPGSPVQLPA